LFDILPVRLLAPKPFKVRLHLWFKASHLLNDTMALNVTKLVQNAQLPVRATADSAGYDLFSTDNYVVLPGRRVVVSTGISVQLPPGTYGRIAPRSGLAVKHGLDTLAGVIDPDYTGEIKVVLQNLDMNQPFVIRPGYRIAQLILEKYTVAEVNEVPTENTPLTQRGASGFGATGI
jgi:dUTP pyrophosphatase